MSVDLLKSFIKMKNILDEADVDEKTCSLIGQKALHGFNEDLHSMTDWLHDAERAAKLMTLKSQKKARPLPNSANIKLPLITKAITDFTSSVYPEIFIDGKVAKCRVLGMTFEESKQDRAERCANYINYQLLFENNEWETSFDQLLTQLGLVGCIFQKNYYDPIRKRICSEICDYKDLIVNSDVRCLKDARRISHVLHVRLNDLIENANAGIFCQDVVDNLILKHALDDVDPHIEIVEQHTFIDMDGDHYKEPYILTFLKETGECLGLVARFDEDCIKSEKKDGEDKIIYVDAEQYFVDYHFLVSPNGKFQSVGFGLLLLHLNELANTLANELTDAGQLANMQGGLKDSRAKNVITGNVPLDPGEWRDVKLEGLGALKDAFLPNQYKEPSSVLYQLLGLIMDVSKELASTTEVMTGATDASNAKTGAVNALQQAGMKGIGAIKKRIYRSLGQSLKQIFRLNSEYADPKLYYDIVGSREFIAKEDFDPKTVDIIPVADPNLSSEAQRSQRNAVLIAAQQLPGTDKVKLTELILQNSNLNVPLKEIMVDPSKQQPSPEQIELQAKIQNMAETNQLKGHELQIREKELMLEVAKTQAQLLELRTKALLNVAQAQSLQDNGKFQEYQMQLDLIDKQISAMQHAAEFGQSSQMHLNEMNMRQQEIDNDKQQQNNEVAGQSSDSEASGDTGQ